MDLPPPQMKVSKSINNMLDKCPNYFLGIYGFPRILSWTLQMALMLLGIKYITKLKINYYSGSPGCPSLSVCTLELLLSTILILVCSFVDCND